MAGRKTKSNPRIKSKGPVLGKKNEPPPQLWAVVKLGPNGRWVPYYSSYKGRIEAEAQRDSDSILIKTSIMMIEDLEGEASVTE